MEITLSVTSQNDMSPKYHETISTVTYKTNLLHHKLNFILNTAPSEVLILVLSFLLLMITSTQGESLSGKSVAVNPWEPVPFPVKQR